MFNTCDKKRRTNEGLGWGCLPTFLTSSDSVPEEETLRCMRQYVQCIMPQAMRQNRVYE